MKKLSYIALFAASCMVLIAQGPTAFTRIRMLIVATGTDHQPLIETTLSGTTTSDITMDRFGTLWIEPVSGLNLNPGQGLGLCVSNVGCGWNEDQIGNAFWGNLSAGTGIPQAIQRCSLQLSNICMDIQTIDITTNPTTNVHRGGLRGWLDASPLAWDAPGLNFPKAYTVSTLPTCSGSNKTGQAVVTDATTPTYLGTLIGGGAVTVPVQCNGTAWVSY